ncbi:hypothetical protein O6H91_13G009400 [Diphasiastrum complanatum]|uniref:Uncharacterized protein n=1 Tax=Diphasiastrum complanatum TaxID=34168 RepID=A0ACC2BS50_DIPCM|nr:hypothetical protein O6H91_13G009400 [Diphasiastrum complanatum]
MEMNSGGISPKGLAMSEARRGVVFSASISWQGQPNSAFSEVKGAKYAHGLHFFPHYLKWANRFQQQRIAIYAHCTDSMNKDELWRKLPLNKPWLKTKVATLSGQSSHLEDLWAQFFRDPSQWWDNRFNKRAVNAPDFKHKETKEVLWVNSWSNPPWVREKLATVSADQAKYGQEHIKEVLWRQLFLDPSNWWDHRFDKTNPNFPDFKHKKMQQALWIDRQSTPKWVKAELAAMAPNSWQRSPFSWHAMITRSLKEKEYVKALELFQQMQVEGVNPNKSTLIQVLKACTMAEKLEDGKRVHAHIIAHGYESDVFIASCLIDMYRKCGQLHDASRIFNDMPLRDVVAWSTMIQAYTKSGQGERALELYRQMEGEGLKPDSLAFVSVLNACASLASLEEGRRIHRQVIKTGCESNVVVGNCLINMYAKCGSIDDAEAVFNGMSVYDGVSWTTMILGYVHCGKGSKAIEKFRQMQQEGMEPDHVTFVAVLNACTSIMALEDGRYIHAQVIRSGCKPEIIGNCLIDLYAKCGSIEDACQVFSHMAVRDVVSWNTMIGGYVKSGEGGKALALFQQMQWEQIEPDPTTFVCVLNACATVKAFEEARRIHAHVVEMNCDTNVFIRGSLVHAYSKCGFVQEAWEVFSKLPVRDVISWSSMILGFAKSGYGEKALELFQQMQREEVVPDQVTFIGVLNACASLDALEVGRSIHEQIIQCGYQADAAVESCLVDMYAKCGSIEEACRVFNAMSTRDVVSWSAMIVGYVKCGQGEKALELFHRMQSQGVQPDLVTYLGALNACASIAALEQGRHIHSQVSQSGWESDNVIGSCLVDMYAKCGSIVEAQYVFDKMQKSDAISWNALLGGYAMHGLGREALHTFEKICQGCQMDGVTFVSLLSSCSHAGLLDEGQYYFESMNPIYSILTTLEHCCCMVDLFGRSGALTEAENIIKCMPLQPNVPVWMALLSACRTYKNLEIGERAAKQILQLDPENSST